ncbi:Crp/Fnr family transcriptional regulator [Streptomyces sp. NBC_00582]|uniref:Crp/Fnr family transcriptional regulator n=1 Tax=Streptomyces sp. NBC_00582 TaxID=2975783 RepID=UPI002E803EF2|nr:Crp/Fnr family transcriptional regulator [Streptomyces sp. NBC_00582]WUB60499.1 Crp/Fnr family transcriptional regulator [Streptomyces sp. NBC_00582]
MGLVVQDRTFLEALTADARKELHRISAERTFRPDEHLLMERDESTHVLVLLEGWAVVSTAVDRSSARLILALRRKGEVVGEMAALGDATRSATVTALGPVRALVVSGARFRAFVGRDPEIGGLLMAQLVARLRTADEERRALASLTVLQRIAARLLELAELQGNPAPTSAGGPVPAPAGAAGTGADVRADVRAGARAGGRPGGAGARCPAHEPTESRPRADDYPVLAELAQHDLADAVGATREAVAKALRLLRGAGVVRTRPRRVELIDRDALRLLAAGGNIGFPAR